MAKILIPRSDSISVKVIEPSDFEKFFSSDIINDYVKSGFELTAGTGLTVNIAVGLARLKGLFIDNSTSSSKGSLTASNVNYIYVTLARDSNSEAESWDFTSNITGTTPTDSLFIGTATTNGSSVTATDITSRTSLATPSKRFGTGIDGAKTTTDGETFSAGDHKQYTTFTVPVNTTLNLGKNILIYASESITINGTIDANGEGSAGGGGSGGTAGTAGTAGSSGTSTVPAVPSYPSVGGSGTAGQIQNNSTGGTGVGNITSQSEVSPPEGALDQSLYALYDTMFAKISNYGAGGNGGSGGRGGQGGRGATGNPNCGGGAGGNGGGGGSGGAGGGSVFFISPRINLGANSIISANGTNGSGGGAGGAGVVSCVSGAAGGAGGNGAGGNGGFVLLAYTNKTFISGYSITVSGGSVGSGGTGGSNGKTGVIKELFI